MINQSDRAMKMDEGLTYSRRVINQSDRAMKMDEGSHLQQKGD